jgi:phosphoribosylanthranilate isomerase
MTKIKLCGFTEKTAVQTAIDQQVDFLGFIFCENSPRFTTPENAAIISAQVPHNIARVAVVANADFNYLNEIITKFSPDFVQFHGDEDVEFLKTFHTKFPKIKIIKAFRITSALDLEPVKNFENYADIFLFDSKTAGSGKKFDWKILQNFSSKKDWFLSGGLSASNVETALKTTNTKMIDISSGIEKIRGQKSPELIIELTNKIRHLCL